MSSVDQQLCIQDCFSNIWVYRSGMYWSVSMVDNNNDKATICMSNAASVSCPGGACESHTIQYYPTTTYPRSALFNNGTIEVTYVNSPTKGFVIVNIADIEEEPDPEPEPEETNVKTARIGNFSISGHSPYMVGSMINFEVDVEWLADTRLCIAVTPAFISNNTWYSCGPTSGKDSNEETKGTKIRYKGAFTVSADMLKHTNQQLAVYFIVTDNNSYIEQDYKFIPIEVIETTYPDDHPIWDDPDPVDPDPDPDDPDIIPEINDNIWFYVTIILFIGLIGVMLWSSR